MKAKKIWLAQDPNDKDNFEISFNEPAHYDAYFLADGDGTVAIEFKEYILIEVDND